MIKKQLITSDHILEHKFTPYSHIESNLSHGAEKTHAGTKRKKLLKADVRQQYPLYYQWFLLQNIK